jgi:hypothetical protein
MFSSCPSQSLFIFEVDVSLGKTLARVEYKPLFYYRTWRSFFKRVELPVLVFEAKLLER